MEQLVKMVFNEIKQGACTRVIAALLLGLSFFYAPSVQAQLHDQVRLNEYIDLPAQRTGAFMATSGNTLIFAGGLDEVGEAFDEIWLLRKGRWERADIRLPKRLAHGVAIGFKGDMLLFGGTDGQVVSSSVYVISTHGGKLRLDSLTQLPVPLAYMTGTLVDQTVLLAGGRSDLSGSGKQHFYALNLNQEVHQATWVELPSWNGPERVQAVSATFKSEFFLFGGRDSLGTQAESLRDAYRFVPMYQDGRVVSGKWQRLADLPADLADGPGPAAAFGLDHLLYPAQQDHEQPGESLLLAYHVGTDAWMDFGTLPGEQGAWGGTLIKWEQDWLATMDVGESTVLMELSKKKEFGWVNWLTLVVYLGFMLWIGFIYDKKEEQTTSNFFTAGGRIPWWAAGISIYGTQISAITFMAIPAIVFATDWSLAIGSVLILATVPIVVRYYIPFFRRLSITSAYEYLEHRFHKSVRLLGSISFILFQLGRTGIVLYLPAVAIASVTGSNIYGIIAIMGFICIIYTVMGGIEAVIWTDFAQVVVLMGGAIVCLIVGVMHVDGGLDVVISQGLAEGKFTWYHLGWDPSRLVLWVCIVGFFFLNIIPYTSDQTIVQRYLTVKDEKSAAKSLWVNSWITLPGTVVFFGLGTVLYVFYTNNPDVIAADKVDEILPYFVVQQLPAGIAGLVIAGIFAASQATMSSSMNSIAASFTSDIFQALSRQASDRSSLTAARWATIGAGVFGTVSAMFIALLDVQFIFDLFQEVLGVLGGSLAGVFILGIFTKRANTMGAVAGLVIGVLAVWLTKSYTDISVYLYGAISVVSCVIGGYLCSFFKS